MQRELTDVWSNRLGKREAAWTKVGVGRRGLEYIWKVESTGHTEGWHVEGTGKGRHQGQL